ncbi:histidine phosphatase family protein [Lysinibacillus sp. BW-2-10]|uniref:histidine phosphatase family protein n=1 Tax=Lysinibacillus sp. BW-2-10 TaxID=2590030 RepID=UPI00117E52D1|nr:histidine phosphatase family protein [Lysinibacillus sp. BW-2-10]TSI03354.1 fructose-2,6-bisphosphatase [Lysinibacillus sp. BW-2-10]
MGNSVVVHLIRHEKTRANYERKYIGWTDESIVMENNQFTIPLQPQIVYGSDLKRCMETAKLYFPQASYQSYEQLRELNFGDLEMKTYDQLKNNPIYRKWIDYPEKITIPNGESFQDFSDRVLDCFKIIVTKPSTYTFVVHGGVIKVLLATFGSKNQAFREAVANHRMIYTLKWSEVSNLKGGLPCELLSVAPIMVKENL